MYRRVKKERKVVKIEKHPLLPSITMEQVLAFLPGRPETATPSEFMNQVLTAMFNICPLSTKNLGTYLDTDGKKVQTAVEMLTGLPFNEVRELWAHHHVARMKKEHPKMSAQELAQIVGYASPSGLWKTDHREVRKKEYRRMRDYCLKSLSPLQRKVAETIAKYK